MKKISLLMIIGLLLLMTFIAPTAAFSVSSMPTYNPNICYVGTNVSAHMTIVYGANETLDYADLVYQTDLENATWNIKLFKGGSEEPLIQFNRTGRSDRISWFDIYQTSARSYVDFTLNGEVPNYKTEMVLFTLYESTKSKVMNEYKSEVIPVYDKEQIKNNLTTLKQELNVQKGYIDELSQFTDVAVLQQMAGNYSTSLQQYEGIQFIPKDENELLIANMNSLKESVKNYQRAYVSQNLNSVYAIVQKSGYYNEYLQLSDKLNRDDYSDSAVTKSKMLVYYVNQEQQDKETLKMSIIALIIVLVVGGVIMLLMIRNRNRKQLDEIF